MNKFVKYQNEIIGAFIAVSFITSVGVVLFRPNQTTAITLIALLIAAGCVLSAWLYKMLKETKGVPLMQDPPPPPPPSLKSMFQIDLGDIEEIDIHEIEKKALEMFPTNEVQRDIFKQGCMYTIYMLADIKQNEI